MTMRRTTETLATRAMPQHDPRAISDIRALHSSLLRLHKTLLDAERVRYERLFGRVENELHLLQLASHDVQFAWLRPLMDHITRIDELLAGDVPVTGTDTASVGTGTRALLRPSEDGNAFARNYHRALQAHPEVVMAHGGVMRGLPAESRVTVEG
jgi:hypothetical protein